MNGVRVEVDLGAKRQDRIGGRKGRGRKRGKIG